MITNPYEYLAEMERQRLFTAGAAVPEHDASVGRTYLDLYQSHLGGIRGILIVLVPEGPGLYMDPLDGRDSDGWALMGAIRHPVLPLAPGPLLACLDPEQRWVIPDAPAVIGDPA